MPAATAILAAILLTGASQAQPPAAPPSLTTPPAQYRTRVMEIGRGSRQPTPGERAAVAAQVAQVMARANADADAMRAISDPPRDAAHPASNRQLVIPSGPIDPALGRPAEMNALFFQAAGAGPHPTVLLLHGLPGNERNLDLAQAVRRAGWNVLTFTYRGAWGSEGRFSIPNAVDDTRAALAWLRSAAAARGYGVDDSRIVIAGHSMGGYMAASVSAEDRRRPNLERLNGQLRFQPYLAGLILLDAWNIGPDAAQMRAAGPAGRAGFIAGFDDVGHSLGPVTADDLYDQIVRLGPEWDLTGDALPLGHMPVLTITATHGGAEGNRPLTDSIRFACTGQRTGSAARLRPCPTLTAVEVNSDHSFADSRVRLAREVVGWLSGAVGVRR